MDGAHSGHGPRMSWQGPFTVRGRMDGDVVVTWDDGGRSGTPGVVDAVGTTLEARDQIRLSPQDQDREADVHDAAATMAAVQEVLEVSSVEGDPPIPEPDSSAT